ncbi:ribonuclease H-like domain-containing protein [Tanacetum coccineum]
MPEQVGVGEFSPPYYISQLGESLIISESFDFGDIHVIYAWALQVEGGFVSSCRMLFTISHPTVNHLKLLGFSNDNQPILEATIVQQCLSTLHFLKILKNGFEVLKLLENSLEVLKILENKMESMKILENKLESLKLQENQLVDGFVPLSIKNFTSKSVLPRLLKSPSKFINSGLSLNFGPSDFHKHDSNQKNESQIEKPKCSFAFGDYNEYQDEQNTVLDVVDENPKTNYHKWEKLMSFEPDIPETPLYKSKHIISKHYKKETYIKVGNIFDNKEALDLVIRLKVVEDGYQFLTDRHAFIALAVHNEFPLAFCAVCCRHLMMNLSLKNKKTKGLFWKICKAYTPEGFSSSMNNLQVIQPNAHHKLCEARRQRWSRAYFPLVRYNYLTSNSVESINVCTVLYRKPPVLKLAKTYRAMVQDWYFKRRKLVGMKVIKNDYDTNVMYDIANVARKLQLFVSHYQIDLSTVLIPNDGSLEESFAENGNSFKPRAQTTTNVDGSSTTLIPGPITTEEKVQKKNDVKPRSMLLMALPNKHLMTFNQYKDAKNLFAAIQTRFGGNEATKKTQKTLLKQMYDNFSAPSTESIDSIFNRLQNIVSQLAILAFVSSPSSTDEINTAYGVSTANTLFSPASTQVSTASTQESTANLSDAIVYAFLASKPNGSQLVHKDLEQIHEDDIKEIHLKWNQDTRNRNQDSSRRTVNVEETTSKAMLAIDGASFDWSYMADDEVPTNMALMAFSDSEFNKSEFNLATYKRGLASVEEQLVFYKKNEVIFCEQLVVLKRDISYKDSEISVLKSELEKLKQEKESNQLKIENFDNASKSLDKLIWSQIPDKSRKGVGFISYNVVPPPHTGLFSPLKIDLSYSSLEEFKQPEFESNGPKFCEIESKNASEDIPNELKEYHNAPLVKDRVSDNKDCLVESPVVVEKKTVVPTIAKVEVVRPKQQEKPVRKIVRYDEMYKSQGPKGNQRNWNNLKSQLLGINTAKGKVNNARPKAVNTARPSPTVVNTIRENQGHPQKVQEDQGYVDSGCSWHMIGNMFYLSDFKEFNGGYVTFGGGANGGKIIVPRKNNMYSVDMKNIVPKESLTYLVAKATLDESMLWHRRLGHKRNRTLIEAARTMLADSKLPTTFWAEAVNTACYVQNRMLVVKPHKKSPYELFRGRAPTLSFMSPFGCHVTILNTLDYLGKFDGNFDEGLFVGYSLNSKAFKVYNIRTRKVEEKLHIRFLEDKPIIADDGLEWLFDIDMLTKSMNYVPVVADGSPLFDSFPKISDDAGSPPSGDTGKKHDEMPGLETIEIYDDSEEEADFNNLESSIHVSHTPTTRIHKNHPLKQVIRSLYTPVQKRSKLKPTNE